MGICLSSECDHKPNPDAVTGTIDHLTAGDASSVSDMNSCMTVGSTHLTTWVSQVSGSFTSIWGDDNANQPESQNSDDRDGDDEDFKTGAILAGTKLKVFAFSQLKAATYNFRKDMILGKGGFGKVYKGWRKEKLPSMGIKKSAIAVKKLDARSRQGFKQWRAEVNALGRLSHPNLVKLLGYCYENNELLLVYEYMHNGSLNHRLFGKGSVRPFPWDIRLKVARGVAQALAYLHSPETLVIHRDLKSSNILLDKFYNPKIADFGLASLIDSEENSRVSTNSMTYGYAAPEVVNIGHFYTKSDVYSFGVVLIEMLTGLRAIDTKRPNDQRFLVNWVKPHLSNKRKLKKIMDKRLEGKYPLKEASLIAQLAIRCLQAEPRIRPSMKEISETLQQVEARGYNTTRA